MDHTLFLIGSSLFVLLGAGHTLTEVAMGSQPPREEISPAIEAMKRSEVPMPGGGVSLFMLMRGFSLMMGLLLIGFGLLNLLLPAKTIAIVALDAAVSAIGLALSIRYLFVVPIVSTASCKGSSRIFR